ncbi:MAG: AzlD domain-containing protein [Candidatus Nanopelagicales bacterium]
MWPAVLIASAGCFLLKLVGYVVPKEWLDDRRVSRVTSLIPVAMLAALVVVQTVGAGQAVTLDARMAGVGAGFIALLLRAPFLVVVVVAGAVAAGLRYSGWTG